MPWEKKGSKIYKMFGLVLDMNKEYGSFVLVILLGAGMAAGVLLKLFSGVDIDSDWFWFLAGIGLAIEGVVCLRSRIKFDREHKVVPRG